MLRAVLPCPCFTIRHPPPLSASVECERAACTLCALCIAYSLIVHRTVVQMIYLPDAQMPDA